MSLCISSGMVYNKEIAHTQKRETGILFITAR